MHRPSITDILKPGESYYSLVIAVAKKARDISEKAHEQGEILIEKPVQMAVEQFAKGQCNLIEQENIGVDIE